MREQLSGAVEKALAASTPPPSNESETCFRIIEPLLLAMGYDYMDIKVQDTDNAKQKPDYTVLPNSPDFTWFLEAKAWDVSLSDQHAIQAVNYANTQGKRWVVLSNGRDWRLYDNHTLGTVEVKLACVAKLGDESFISFLEALSKASIHQGKLEDFVRNERLYSSLAFQITRHDSDVVKAIIRALKGAAGLSTVTPADVVGFFRDYAPGGPHPAEHQCPPLTEHAVVPPPSITVTQPILDADGAVPLGSLSSQAITRRRIKGLVLPDGRVLPITKWFELSMHVAIYVFELESKPMLPFFTSKHAKSPQIAKFGTPESERMRQPKQLPAPHSEYLSEAHHSADGHQHVSKIILRAAGVDPATLGILLDSTLPSETRRVEGR